MAEQKPSRQEVRVTISVGEDGYFFSHEEIAVLHHVEKMDPLQFQEAMETAVSRAMDYRDAAAGDAS